ncbi:hypothetical protein [Clostridium sp. D33t1_170424_F3]|uniref:hypothetical protein n=1 Tax=Clostridium sp. D33t1_170424_F3 TaxID=2787099 RepID=UPI0018AB8E45|nr:hypothetical protein [Clostridium sp. D33t1_170424_F3]
MTKLLKESWLSLMLVFVILATVCAATFAWREDVEQTNLTAEAATLNVKLDFANEEPDPGILNLTALQEGQTVQIPFFMENNSDVPAKVYFIVNSDQTDLLDQLDFSIEANGEVLEETDESGFFVAEIEKAEEDADPLAYSLIVKAKENADLTGWEADTVRLFITADVQFTDASVPSVKDLYSIEDSEE